MLRWFAGWLALACVARAGSTGIAQWDFDGDLNSSVGGAPLVADFAAPATSPHYAIASMPIAGGIARVATFPRGTFFRATHGLGANGGGTRLNQFTLIVDLDTPSRPSGWAALYQSNPANTDDGEWFVNPAGGIGISGVYGGTVPDGVWARLALVVDAVAGTFDSYVDGQPVQHLGRITVDGRWSIGPEFLLFADENQENAPGLVNSVQLRSWAMAPEELLAIGGPTAGGIPGPASPSVVVASPNGTESWPAGSTHDIVWNPSHPLGTVKVQIDDGTNLATLAELPMSQGRFAWAIPPWQGPGPYRIRIESTVYPTANDASDSPFVVTGGNVANPRFDTPLLDNGGFENLLDGWSVAQGRPVSIAAGATHGTPHGGSRFLFGGSGSPGDFILRRDLDLDALGFAAADLDGAVVETDGWLRNRYGAGTFDDQVFYRVGFLDASGRELASVRSMVAADSVWLERPLAAPLPAGTRRLRLDIVGRQRRDADNDSMADDLGLRLRKVWPPPASSPAITKLPMLQDVRPDAMTLLWETDRHDVVAAVEWGRTATTENTLSRVETLRIDATHFVHRATIGGLERETEYVYRVRNGTTVSPAYKFRTAPRPETPFVAAWWGDNHNGTTTLRTHVANLMGHGPDLICVAGDMVNSGNALNEWHDYWFKPLEHLNAAQTTPVVFARGNHDGEHALAYAYSALSGNESWYAFDYGNSRFIFLDSEADGSVSPEQLAWLGAELSRPATREAAFRIVCFHRPPWSEFWNGGGHTQEPFVVNEWVPLFKSGGVDLVVCGHEHAYHRGQTNGTYYVVSGGGGGVLDTERVARWPHVQVEYSKYHFDILTVNGRRMSWETYDDQGRLLDEFAVASRVPTLRVEATAGTPPVARIEGRAGLAYRIETAVELGRWRTEGTVTIGADGSPAAWPLATGDAARFVRVGIAP